jgi:hypothetical protein
MPPQKPLKKPVPRGRLVKSKNNKPKNNKPATLKNIENLAGRYSPNNQMALFHSKMKHDFNNAFKLIPGTYHVESSFNLMNTIEDRYTFYSDKILKAYKNQRNNIMQHLGLSEKEYSELESYDGGLGRINEYRNNYAAVIYELLNSINEYNINLYQHINKNIDDDKYYEEISDIKRNVTIVFNQNFINIPRYKTAVTDSLIQIMEDLVGDYGDILDKIKTINKGTQFGGSGESYNEKETIMIIDILLEWMLYFSFPPVITFALMGEENIKTKLAFKRYDENSEHFLDVIHFLNTDEDDKKEFIDLMKLKHVSRYTIDKNFSNVFQKTNKKSTFAERKTKNKQSKTNTNKSKPMTRKIKPTPRVAMRPRLSAVTEL